MKGYKAFNPDMTCRGFQYEEGKEYTLDGELQVCKNGFHFCKDIMKTRSFYGINSVIHEVEAIGNIITEDNYKYCTDKIIIGKRIECLEDYIIRNDPIFLLSISEYIKNKNLIPKYIHWWWLRSPGYYSDYAAIVYYGGSVGCDCNGVYSDYGCVRPAFRINKSLNLRIGSEIMVKGRKATVINSNLAIFNEPICNRRFDAKYNDYEHSEIRQWLLDWWNNEK